MLSVIFMGIFCNSTNEKNINSIAGDSIVLEENTDPAKEDAAKEDVAKEDVAKEDVVKEETSIDDTDIVAGNNEVDENTEEIIDEKKNLENKSEEDLKEHIEVETAIEEVDESEENLLDNSSEKDEEGKAEKINLFSFQVLPGDSSETLSIRLQESGIIENSSEFNDFLCDNGYSRILRVGNYQIEEGASQEQIAKLATGR